MWSVFVVITFIVSQRSKLFISPNRYAALLENSASAIEVFSPPPVTVPTTNLGEVAVDHISPAEPSPSEDTRKSPPNFIKKKIST